MPITVKRGALVRLDRARPEPQAIVFACNPESLSTSMQAASGQVEQVIRFTLQLDATDALEKPEQNPQGIVFGVYPTLAALELMLQQDARTDPNGVTVFAWGPRRTLAVRVIGLQIAETLFNPQLNPIQASVQITLRAWNATDAAVSPAVLELVRQRQAQLEALARFAYGVIRPKSA